jgi:hypothetical protein
MGGQPSTKRWMKQLHVRQSLPAGGAAQDPGCAFNFRKLWHRRKSLV